MRSPLPLAAALILAASSATGSWLHAQTVSTSTTVRADVVNGLRIHKISDVDFGVVPSGSGVTLLNATDAGAGRFHIFGQNGRTVTVTITAPAALASGANSIPFVGAASVNESADDPGPAFTMKLRDQGPTKNGRLGYLWIHGAITVGPATAPGVYSGTVTITAEQ
jgi:spore coat protein U-like protein